MFDFEIWNTPDWAVRRLLEEVWLPPGAWIEPFAGNGDIIRAVCEDRPGQIQFTAVELRPECHDSLATMVKSKNIHCPREFLTGFSPHNHRQLEGVSSYFDVAITNPPATKALEALPKCLCMAEYVAILQPHTWLGRLKKQPEFLHGIPPDIYVLPDGICGMTYAWFVWGPKNERFKDEYITRELQATSLKERGL